MKKMIAWIGKNLDPILALTAAVAVAALEIVSDTSPTNVDTGILLVLGVLSVAVLRDRLRTENTEQDLRAELRRVGETRTALGAVESEVARIGQSLDDASMVQVLNGRELSQALAEARRTTDRWIFRGGTGTYTRAVTLPECVANARRERRTLLVRLEIIDPTDETVCASYVRFRHSLSGDQSGWTVERTQRESYATIVACCWYRQQYDLLDVAVRLSRVMPTLRWDLSASSLVITQESPHKPALLTRGGKLLYTYLETELRKSFEQAQPVPLGAARQIRLSDPPTVDEVRRLFTVLDMPLPSSFTDRDVQDIVTRAVAAENPYEQ